MNLGWFLLKVELPTAPPEAFDYYIMAVANVPQADHMAVLSDWRETQEGPIKNGQFHPLPQAVKRPALPIGAELIEESVIFFFTQLHKGVGYVEAEPATAG